MRTLYPLWKQSLIDGSANVQLNGAVQAALVNCLPRGYVYSAAHQFYSSVQPFVVSSPQSLSNMTYVNGLFAANPTLNFPSVPQGASVDAIVVFIATGVAAASRLVLYLDDANGLPLVPDGGDETITWDTAGIFQL